MTLLVLGCSLHFTLYLVLLCIAMIYASMQLACTSKDSLSAVAQSSSTENWHVSSLLALCIMLTSSLSRACVVCT